MPKSMIQYTALAQVMFLSIYSWVPWPFTILTCLYSKHTTEIRYSKPEDGDSIFLRNFGIRQ
jgi:hypothetical protein